MACLFPNLAAITSYGKGCRCGRCVKRFACTSCGAGVWLADTTCIPCRTTPLITRVLARVVTDPATGCWLWMGSVNQWGYGRVFVDKRTGMRVVHRVTWEHAYGPVAAPLQLDHLCSVPRCCNPDHLEPVTPGENSRRARDRRLARSA